MSRTGYLIIDHRVSPGMPGSALCGEGRVYEADTLCCSHCRGVVIKNPDRFRARGHCPRCDAFICDICAVAYHQNKVCRPFAQVVADVKDGRTIIPVLASDVS